MHSLVVERLYSVCLADVREKNLEDVWSIENLAFNLGSLLDVEFFKDYHNSGNDRAYIHDWFHILLIIIEII